MLYKASPHALCAAALSQYRHKPGIIIQQDALRVVAIKPIQRHLFRMLRHGLIQPHLSAKSGQVGKLFLIRLPCRSILDPFAVHAVVIGSVSIQSGSVCVKGQIGGGVIILGNQAATTR